MPPSLSQLLSLWLWLLLTAARAGGMIGGPSSALEDDGAVCTRDKGWVRCVLPAGRVELATPGAGDSLWLRCKTRSYNCSELAVAQPLLTFARPTLAELKVEDCALPAAPLACLLQLVAEGEGEKSARRLKLVRPRGVLLPEHVRGLGPISRLRIQDATDMTRVPYAAVTSLTSLEVFAVLDAPQLTLETAASPASLSSLTTLELAASGIESLPASCFRHTPRVTRLMLWGNKIKDIDKDAFEGLSELKTVILNANQLSSVPANMFRGAPSVRTVHLQDNPLQHLHAGVFSHLADLAEVWIFNNKANLTLAPAAFSDLPALAKLRVHNSHIHHLPEDLFYDTPSLTSLDIARNRLTFIPEDIFRDQSLKMLNMSRNNLKDIPGKLLKRQNKLVELVLSHNSLTNIPNKFFSWLEKLTDLDLKYNHLEVLQDSLFLGLGELKRLHLTGNRIHTIRAATLAPLRLLEEMYLGHNKLESSCPRRTATTVCDSPFVALRNLLKLDLSHNQLTEILSFSSSLSIPYCVTILCRH